VPADPRHSAKLILCLAAVYLIWGSTFMATKVATSHLPIALFSAVRFLCAGSVLSLVARFGFGYRFPRDVRDWRHIAITGVFMVCLSNGLNAWSIKYLPSGQAAMLSGTTAFWIAGLGTLGARGQPLTRATSAGLCIGFFGTVLMMIPKGVVHQANLIAQAGVLTASLAFSIGTLYYRSVETRVASMMFMAMQLTCGGVILSIVALLHGDAARWHASAPGYAALVYLALVSSCLAFTAYGWLTRNVSPALIGTFSYVNPAIATLLGWWFLNEHLSQSQLLGMAVIIVGVSILTLPAGTLRDAKTLEEPSAP
jgi:drug/metabolite transporter (DMT)-like permease